MKGSMVTTFKFLKMQSKTIKLEYFITVTYDENSEPFKSVRRFPEIVREGAEAEDMLKNDWLRTLNRGTITEI